MEQSDPSRASIPNLFRLVPSVSSFSKTHTDKCLKGQVKLAFYHHHPLGQRLRGWVWHDSRVRWSDSNLLCWHEVAQRRPAVPGVVLAAAVAGTLLCLPRCISLLWSSRELGNGARGKPEPDQPQHAVMEVSVQRNVYTFHWRCCIWHENQFIAFSLSICFSRIPWRALSHNCTMDNSFLGSKCHALLKHKCCALSCAFCEEDRPVLYLKDSESFCTIQQSRANPVFTQHQLV